MLSISIMLTENNDCYLQKIHPDPLTFNRKDQIALMIGSLIKIDSLAVGTADQAIDRKVYVYEREIFYSNSRFKRSGAMKIKFSTIVAINNLIDRMMKRHLFRYIYLKKTAFPYLMYKDCIQLFIDELGLSESDKLFETLKKFDYRKRTSKDGNSTILWQ